MFVLDTSVALTWAFEDESSPVADAALKRLASGGAHVPILFGYEVRNVLISGERKRRIDAARVSGFLAYLQSVDLTYVPPPSDTATTELSRQETLTVYDASYVDLAHRLRSPLATLDRSMRRAAERIGVALL